MRSSLVLFLLLFTFALNGAVNGPTPYRARLSFPDLPSGARSEAMVADSDGNLFIIAKIVKSTGRPQIRVLKTDPQGNSLASIEFGGSNSGALLDDTVAAAAVDPKGNLVITGSTTSDDFPLVSPLNPSSGEFAGFVVKIDSQLKGILFSTKLGGTHGYTFSKAIAVDPSGNIYVTGSTTAADFPVTNFAFQKQPPASGSGAFAFLTEISSDSKVILFSTYFGNSSVLCTGTAAECSHPYASTIGSAIALDAAGSVIIAGTTNSNRLPVTPGVFGPTCGDCSSRPSAWAGFVAKFAAGGSALVWATYVPITQSEPYIPSVDITALSIDGTGSLIIGGTTTKGFAVTAGVVQPLFPGSPGFLAQAGFVMKLNPSAQRVIFSTYLGGGLTQLAGDPLGAIWVTGYSPVDALPVPKGTPLLGEAYLAMLAADGSGLTNVFTAPSGGMGRAVVVDNRARVTALGRGGTLVTLDLGAGPSLLAVGNSAGGSVSNAIAPYEFISLYGLGLGPSEFKQGLVVGDVISTSLADVQVLFDGIPAPLLFAGPNQINAVVPSVVAGRDTARLRIVTPAGTIEGPTMLIRRSQPQVFSAPGLFDFAPAAVARNEDGSMNSRANAAALGSKVTVWVSGAGVSSDSQPDGTILRSRAGAPALPVSVFSFALLSALRVGQVSRGLLSIEVVDAKDATGSVAGLTEITFRLPASLSVDPFNAGFAVMIGGVTSDPFAVSVKPAQ